MRRSFIRSARVQEWLDHSYEVKKKVFLFDTFEENVDPAGLVIREIETPS